MAEIWLAQQRAAGGFEKLVAVKRILPGLASREEFVRMFLDEARLAAQLSHPNIVQIYDLGQAGNTYYIAMEFIHGENLRLITRRAYEGEGVPIPIAVKIISDAALALHYAHHKQDLKGQDLGVVHRDISPQNLLVSYEGLVKVVDFGIAKAAGSLTETRTGVIKGKYPYMSPEQVLARKIDGRSDLYSLGIVLWELLCGKRLYDHPTDFLVMEAIAKGDPQEAALFRKDLPESLGLILDKMLAKDPADRYANGHALHQALEAFLREADQMVSSVEIAAWLRGLFPDRLDTWSKLVEQRELGSIESEVLDELSGFMGMTPSDAGGGEESILSDEAAAGEAGSKPQQGSGDNAPDLNEEAIRPPRSSESQALASSSSLSAERAGFTGRRPKTNTGLRPAQMAESAPDLREGEEHQLDEAALRYGHGGSSASLRAAPEPAGERREDPAAKKSRVAPQQKSQAARPKRPSQANSELSEDEAAAIEAALQRDREYDDQDHEPDDRVASPGKAKAAAKKWRYKEPLRDRLDRALQPARTGIGRLIQMGVAAATVVGMIWIVHSLAKGMGLHQSEQAIATSLAKGLAENAGIVTPGILLLRSYPEGAQVYVDGRIVGLSPMSLDLGKRKRAAKIEFKLTGFETWLKQVEDPSQGAQIEAQLQPLKSSR